EGQREPRDADGRVQGPARAARRVADARVERPVPRARSTGPEEAQRTGTATGHRRLTLACWRFLRRQAVADPRLAHDVAGVRRIRLDFLPQLRDQHPEVFRLADRVRAPDLAQDSA